jgi:hypothetical protein
LLVCTLSKGGNRRGEEKEAESGIQKVVESALITLTQREQQLSHGSRSSKSPG